MSPPERLSRDAEPIAHVGCGQRKAQSLRSELAEPALLGLLPRQAPRDRRFAAILTGLPKQASPDRRFAAILTGLLPHAVPGVLPCPSSPRLIGQKVALREGFGAQRWPAHHQRFRRLCTGWKSAEVEASAVSGK